MQACALKDAIFYGAHEGILCASALAPNAMMSSVLCLRIRWRMEKLVQNVEKFNWQKVERTSSEKFYEFSIFSQSVPKFTCRLLYIFLTLLCVHILYIFFFFFLVFPFQSIFLEITAV